MADGGQPLEPSEPLEAESGGNVRRIRKEMGLTRIQFAERLGVSSITVHRWESGQSRPRRLAAARLQELDAALPAPAEQAAGRERAAGVSPGVAATAASSPVYPPPLDFAADPRALSAVAEALRLAHGHQFNPAFATETARIDPLPHQRIAVYERMLRQEPLRFLLADDAGAGKTIMTGLYVREMLSRGRIRRVLIVPPAGLVGNWERELRILFRLRFRIVSGSAVPRGSGGSRTFEDPDSEGFGSPGPSGSSGSSGAHPGTDDNPFRGPESDLAIVSLDTLAGERAFDALRKAGVPPYDLVVFDEAHKLAATSENHRVRKTRRYELAEALAGCRAGGAGEPAGRFSGLGWAARRLLLLTATPHMGKDSPYHHLWRLLDPQVFSTGEAFRRFPRDARSRHFIRRTKEEMVGLDGRPLYPPRACDTFSYGLTSGPEGERALYDETSAYLLRAYGRALDDRPAVRLAMSVFQRRLASSTWALHRSFERRIEKLVRTIEDLQSGRVSAAELARRQHGLDRRYRDDFFDTHGADDDARDARGGEGAGSARGRGDGGLDPGFDPGFDLGLDPGLGERNEDYEDAVLGAVAAVTVEELRREVETLRALGARASRLIESGSESKFEKLREVLEDPRYADEKWLIFSEHRDTVDYLIRRLEGLGFSGRLARIHGGMAWPEREEQVERFRRPGGARYLVATDAAGEGINLQFCRLMVNYDVPWNPARLEQRMGRIHRYGQKHDVRIVNLVAGDTHEGRVLRVLLEKLEAVRRELRSDKVFDVIGRLFENRSLREYMIEALTDEGERRVVGRVGGALSADRVRGVGDEERRIYGGDGASGEVAGRLDGLRDDVERERYLQLLPGYVRRFVENAAGLLDLEVHGDLDGFFSLVPRRAGALDALLPALEGYPPAARERLCVRRPETEDRAGNGRGNGYAGRSGPALGNRDGDENENGYEGRNEGGAQTESNAPCIWLHPGEAVFDALSRRVLSAFGRDALRGAIFVDPRANAPYFFHLALISVEVEVEPEPEPETEPARKPGGASRAPEPFGRDPVEWSAPPESRASRTSDRFGPRAAKWLEPPEPAESRGSTWFTPPAAERAEPARSRERLIRERRLIGLRHDEAGAPAECPVEHLLLLRGAPEVPPGAVPLASRGISMRAEAASYVEREVLARRVEGHRAAVRVELPERRRRVGVGFDLRAAELAARRTKLAARGAKRSGRDAGAEDEDALDEIKREQRTLSTEKARALARLDTAPERIVPGFVRFLAHALAVPATNPEEVERHDARVEKVAVRIALGWERERGAEVRDVSEPELARSAGLPDWPGFDLLSIHPPGETRRIEVKGRAGQGTIRMEANEWKQACHLGEHYWLYVVFDCATSAPRLARVRDPFAKLLARSRSDDAFTISAASLIEAAEQG